jgi:hypothetical protein
MQAKVFALMAIQIGGFVALPLLTDKTYLGVVWVLLVIPIQFMALRCPGCGALANIRKHGVSSPFVGDQCRHCGREY